MRVSKDPEERKKEIVEAAQQLFIQKGYAETKISDIVKSINVSQGVFYYYFQSKEEIIDEIVKGYIQQIVKGITGIMDSSSLTGVEKLAKISEHQCSVNRLENNHIHAIKGVDIHERVLRGLVLELVPQMSRALAPNGSRENQYKLEIFLSAANVLFDPGIFSWSTEERNGRIDFLIGFMEREFGLNRGDLLFYRKLMRYAE